MKTNTLHNERSLLIAISHGDHKSFATLFNHYHIPFSNFIFKLLKDEEQTNDVLQDVFLGIWINRKKLIDIQDFKNYLFIITRNKVYTLLKERSKKHVLFEPITSDIIENSAEVPLESLENYYTILEKEIENLPDQQKMIFKLIKFKKMKYEDIANMLNISVETVRKHAYLATKTLKTHLKVKETQILFILIFTLYYFF